MLEKLKQRLAERANEVMESIKLSDEEREARFEICRNCEHFSKLQFCKMCGCYMAAKTYIPAAGCPLKKWLPIKSIS